MGKKRTNDEKRRIIEFFRNIKKDVVFDSNKKKFAERKNAIWTSLSKQLTDIGIEMSPLGVFTTVSKNYYDLWNVLDICKNDKENNDFSNNDLSSSSSSLPDLEGVESEVSEDISTQHFRVTLTREEYSSMQEEASKYKRNDRGHKTLQRDYYIWANSSWTSLVRHKIFEQTRLNCTIVFKRVKLHPLGPKFAVISGKCKECNAEIRGELIDNPEYAENIIFNFHISGEFSNPHNTNVKVPFKGNERDTAIREMVINKKSASTVRSELACNIMRCGDTEPAFIPKLGTLRTAKSMFLKKAQIDKDPIIALYKAKSLQDYGNSIHNIGYSPFHVYFWTTSEIMIYRKFCQKNYVRISIDSTGGVAKKIIYPDQLNSKTIFLYEIVINFCGQHAVGSMLTDNHTSVAIQSWLNTWFRAAAISPNEIVVDMSLALMYACVPVFTSFKSLASYLNQCYIVLFENNPIIPEIFLRNDVAHVMKLVSSWDCLKKSHRITKKFYMKAVGQIIQCCNIEDLKNLLEATFSVAYSDTEGLNEEGVPITCERKKQWIIKRIATGTIDSIEEEFLLKNDNNPPFHEKEDPIIISNNFRDWVKQIAKSAEEMVNRPGEVGDRGNQQVLPDFVKEFIKISPTIPIWTSIMCQYYPSSNRLATSAASESNFNQIKHRIFSDMSLPIRIDTFVMEYIKRSSGYLKLVTANLEKMVFHIRSKGANFNSIYFLETARKGANDYRKSSGKKGARNG